MNHPEITTVIPVFDAEETVAVACASALKQTLVAEVLLIEDGSTDNSLALCRELAASNERVRLLQHGGGINRGAGASRNLGWRTANTEWINFLDSDDRFLDGHSERSAAVLAKNPSLDGCYGAVRVEFESPEHQRAAVDAMTVVDGLAVLGMDADVVPEELLEALVIGDRGSVQTGGMTVKKALLEEVGGFDETLEQSQDFELWLRIASAGRLGRVPGNPIAVYWINATSRSAFDDRRAKYWRIRMAEAFLRWAQRTGANQKHIIQAREQFAASWQQHIDLEVSAGRAEVGLQFQRLGKILSIRPSSIRELSFWKDAVWSLGITRPM